MIKLIEKLLIVSAAALFFPICARAASEIPAENNIASKLVLVVSSHMENSEWGTGMIRPVKELEQEHVDVRFYYSHISMTTLSGDEDIARHLGEIQIALRQRRPDILVMVGSSSFMMADDFNAIWPGVPMILTGECDYYCDREYSISGNGRADRDASRYPVSQLTSRTNSTFLNVPFLTAGTLDMMRRLIPGMDRLVFIEGENFQSREQKLAMESLVTSRYPEIKFEECYSTDYSSDELIQHLQDINDGKTGFLFSSWLLHRGHDVSITSRHNTLHILEAIVPMFSFPFCDMSAHPRLVGYHADDMSGYGAELKDRILRVIMDGESPSRMKAMSFADGRDFVNWQAVCDYGMDTGLIGEDAVIFNRPKSFWQLFRVHILTTILLLALFALVIYSLLTRKALSLQEQAKEAAVRSDRMKTVFIQNMSHEIRTPLNSIVGFSQLLGLPSDTITDEEREEYSEYVLNSSKMLTMLVDDILNAADVDSGNYHIEIEDASCNEICRSAIKTTEYRADPDVNVYYTSDVDDSYRVRTDPRRVQQVMINYLTNALKHTHEGEVHVHCSTTEHPGRVTFSVTDTGCGIPADQADNIFERFSKLDAFKQGTGLGLNICREIADRLGGKVYLDTTYTNGARFVFEIVDCSRS